MSGAPLPASIALDRATYSSLLLPALANVTLMSGLSFMNCFALALRLLSHAHTVISVLPSEDALSVPHAAVGAIMAIMAITAVAVLENLIVSSYGSLFGNRRRHLRCRRQLNIIRTGFQARQFISMISTISDEGLRTGSMRCSRPPHTSAKIIPYAMEAGPSKTRPISEIACAVMCHDGTIELDRVPVRSEDPAQRRVRIASRGTVFHGRVPHPRRRDGRRCEPVPYPASRHHLRGPVVVGAHVPVAAISGQSYTFRQHDQFECEHA